MYQDIIKLLSFLCLFVCVAAKAQDSSKLNKALSVPDKLFSSLDKKTSVVKNKLNKGTNKYLTKLQKQEERLKRKLWKKDSSLAKELFTDLIEKYNSFKAAPSQNTSASQIYMGHFDSLSTTLSFLQNNGFPGDPRAQESLRQLKGLQGQFNASEEVRKYLVRRQQYLKEQFEKLGMVKELKKFRKQVYYYQSQIKEYKTLFEDPSKLENKLFELAFKFSQFQNFFAKNSQIGNLFRVPGSTNVSNTSFTGLQTRYAVQQLISTRTGPNSSQFVQTQLRSVNEQLNALRQPLHLPAINKRSKELGFVPNSQKTKSFKDRLEKGFSIDFGKVKNFFPTSANVSVSLGYKINDRSLIGIGTSYKVSLGGGYNDVRFISKGYSFRSFIDWKIQGSFYVYGGYEKIYLPISQPYTDHPSRWHESGLIGLNKKYNVNKWLRGNMQLLYDFLYHKSIPVREPFVFRIGYNF